MPPKKKAKGRTRSAPKKKAAAPADSPQRDDYDGMNLTQLRRECSKRGITAARSKAETIHRLRAHDVNPTAQQGGHQEPAAETKGAGSPQRIDYGSMKMDELRRECSKRDIKAARSKADTIQRLQSWDLENSSAAQAQAGPAAKAQTPPVAPTAQGEAEQGATEVVEKGKSPTKDKTPSPAKEATPPKAKTPPARKEEAAPKRKQQEPPPPKTTSQGSRTRTTREGAAQAQSPSIAEQPLRGGNPRAAEWELEHRHYVDIGARDFPRTRMRQVDVEGDGNCMFRAFAAAFFGDEARWPDVRQHVRTWWNSVTNNRDAPESATRRALYSALNVDTTEHDYVQVGRRNESRDISPTTRIRGEAVRRGVPRQRQNLALQIAANDGAWGDFSMLQVLADAFDVEIFAHHPQGRVRPNGTIDWELITRGAFGRRQIHLINYPELGHWTAALAGRVITWHLDLPRDEGRELHRLPQPFGADILQARPPRITARTVGVPLGDAPPTITIPPSHLHRSDVDPPSTPVASPSNGNEGAAATTPPSRKRKSESPPADAEQPPPKKLGSPFRTPPSVKEKQRANYARAELEGRGILPTTAPSPPSPYRRAKSDSPGRAGKGDGQRRMGGSA